MLHDVSGDIMLTGAPVIVHGVAPNDHFNSGLALQLRTAFPAMYKDFRHYCQQTHAEPGGLWVWSGAGTTGSVQIVSLLTQAGGYEHGARPGKARLEDVNHCLRELHRWIEDEKPSAVAVPRVATGVGGLDWEQVYPLIKQHLSKLETPVYLYTTFRKNVKALEPAYDQAR
jgi:O-acetyl-ADP-ribose deacetylase (regulator of RNase III)